MRLGVRRLFTGVVGSFEQVKYLCSKHNWSQAVEIITANKLRDRSANNVVLKCLRIEKQLSRAEDLFNQIRAREKANVETFNIQIKSLIRQNQIEEAAKLFEEM